ncbi:hypothetical protein PQ462_05455 [Flavobacterium sp. KACC 22758]|uniref:hypothetical protein n=1 Tax=Flavobacterium sp. KACC 22758 TaxID=3025667 RepID=UPI002366A493|nr:hypothetical protein [Flavobacterium sp. KACC 22758]WDF60807.1 hypothetical protein PQ462_05455 [Flavobacterium sp. KACC 22758]
MKKLISLVTVFLCINFAARAQNTTFDNISLGTSYPAYGVQLKANFPGYTGGWGRAYFITNESGSQSFFTFGSTGFVTNGIANVSSSFIGKDLTTRYMTFLPNGNIGIGTENPQYVFQIGNYNNNSNYKLSIPGAYNFEEIRLGQYGNGRTGLEMITHTNLTNSFGVRLYAGTDTGTNGLLIQTADPVDSEQKLVYTTKLSIGINGNVGIGTPNASSKLTVAGNIASREVKVSVDAGADFVFENNYDLPSLESVDKFIKENKHLPEIASAKEMQKDGINLSEMNIKLLQKIEELTLYVIEMKKESEKQNDKILALEKKLKN